MEENKNDEALEKTVSKLTKPKKEQVKQVQEPVIIPKHGAYRG